jgi:cysteine-rich repeat protein
VWAGNEACDDGNQDNTDACISGCEAASCGDGFVWAGNEDCDDQNGNASDGCNGCDFAPKIYTIAKANLFGVPNDCSDTTNPYTSCGAGAQWGFSWSDTTPYVPAAVTIEINHGIQCANGAGKMPTLNGVVAGNFNLNGGNCLCVPAEVVNTWNLDGNGVGAYQEGQQNTFTITASTSCEGISANQNWGNDVYARVTVSP